MGDHAAERKNLFLRARFGCIELAGRRRGINQPLADAAQDPVATDIDHQSRAPGLLSGSLLSFWWVDATTVAGSRQWVEAGYLFNDGFTRMRFVAPVPLGGRTRGQFRKTPAGPTSKGGTRDFAHPDNDGNRKR